MKLPLSTNVSMGSYLLTALPEMVLQLNPKLTPWLYENFINIYSDPYGHLLYSGISFQSSLATSSPFIHYDLPESVRHPEHFNVIEFCKRQITTKNNYIYIFLDESQLPGMDNYGKRHYIHDSLIYGYEESEDCFLAVAQVGHHRIKVKYASQDFKKAYENTFVYSEIGTRLLCFKLSNSLPKVYTFSLDTFLQNLGNYINGDQEITDNYFCGISSERVIFGEKANHYFLDCIDRESVLPFVHYRSVHFITEHRKGLLERFKYVDKNYDFSENLSPLLEQYTSVVNEYDGIRMLALKCHITYKPSDMQRLIYRLITTLEREHSMLINIFHVLTSGVKRDYRYQGSTKDITSITYSPMATNTSKFKFAIKSEVQFSHSRFVTNLRISNVPYAEVYINDKLIAQYVSPPKALQQRKCITIPAHQTGKILLIGYANQPLTQDNFKIEIGRENVALFKSAGSNSTRSSEGNRGFSPAQAFTDDSTTYWSASPEWETDETLTVDLEKEYPISTIRITERPHACRIECFSLLYSMSGSNWYSIIDHHAGSWDQRPMELLDLNITARFIKLVIHETRTDQYGYNEPGISLFEIYE